MVFGSEPKIKLETSGLFMASGAGNNSEYIKPIRQEKPIFYAEGKDVQEALDFLKVTGDDLLLQYRQSASDIYSADRTPGDELNELLTTCVQADQGYNLAISRDGYDGNTLISGTVSEDLPSTVTERAMGLPSIENGIAFDGFTDRSPEELYHEARNTGMEETRLTAKADRAWKTVFGAVWSR